MRLLCLIDKSGPPYLLGLIATPPELGRGTEG
jgi:hypothetical protein